MKNDISYLRHILEAIESIELYLKETKSFDEFKDKKMMISAVIRELEIIGEATSRLSSEFKTNNPQIPFADIIGMRNSLIHEYFGVNKKIVWETCQTDLKDLKRLIAAVLN